VFGLSCKRSIRYDQIPQYHTCTAHHVYLGIVSDIWRPGRAKSFGTSFYVFGLLAGLSMGPVFGSLVVQYTTWRW
jgi:hypothetical protein